jgi:hypothetical protein
MEESEPAVTGSTGRPSGSEEPAGPGAPAEEGSEPQTEVVTGQPNRRSISRRKILLLLTPVVVGAAFAAVLLTRDGSDPRIEVTRAFYQAVATSDCEALDDILAEDAMAGHRENWVEQDCGRAPDDLLSDIADNASLHVTESDERSVIVTATFDVGDDERSADTLLVREHGEWKVDAWLPDVLTRRPPR